MMYHAKNVKDEIIASSVDVVELISVCRTLSIERGGPWKVISTDLVVAAMFCDGRLTFIDPQVKVLVYR